MPAPPNPSAVGSALMILGTLVLAFVGPAAAEWIWEQLRPGRPKKPGTCEICGEPGAVEVTANYWVCAKHAD